MRDILELDPAVAFDDAWTPFSLFDSAERCVANVDAAILPLTADGITLTSGCIRSVAVDPQWRGCGLFGALMAEALRWCDAQASGPTLLYTAEPSIYERFGFRSVAQHAFVGPPPAPGPAAASPELLSASERSRLIPRLARRTPISLQAALLAGPALAATNLAKDDALILADASSLDALVAFEDAGDTLVIADVVAREIPPLSAVLGALGRAPRRVMTLFPPDRLGWSGEPIREETGLMVRGPLPGGLNRPFMFSPTNEF